jgi:DNA-binding MarR family transcriptional regulator
MGTPTGDHAATRTVAGGATPRRPDVTVALHRFGMARDRMRTALARALGIGLTDLDALEHLELDGPLTQTELGDRLLLSSGGVTMLVDRLEHLGAVERRPHPSDRRVTLVHLLATENLTGHLTTLDAYHSDLCAAAAALSDDVRAGVADFLDTIAAKATHTSDTLPQHRPQKGKRPSTSGGQEGP